MVFWITLPQNAWGFSLFFFAFTFMTVFILTFCSRYYCRLWQLHAWSRAFYLWVELWLDHLHLSILLRHTLMPLQSLVSERVHSAKLSSLVWIWKNKKMFTSLKSLHCCQFPYRAHALRKCQWTTWLLDAGHQGCWWSRVTISGFASPSLTLSQLKHSCPMAQKLWPGGYNVILDRDYPQIKESQDTNG